MIERTTAVPLNTMLADLDESLRALLRRELGAHGFDGVEIAFEAPSREWAAALSSPTVSLFLYDLRESEEHHPVEWERRTRDGRTVEGRPPLRMECSYAVTAWTREVEDEHRLLSQVLSVLYAFPSLPRELLANGLVDERAQPYPVTGQVGKPRHEGSPEFWTSLGGSYKASLDYRVTLSVEAGMELLRGPEVMSHTLRIQDLDAPRATREEVHRLRGEVVDESGEAVADAWVVLAEGGPGWVATGPDGTFVLDRLRAGSYRVAARAPDGREGEVQVEVPGGVARVAVGTPRPARGRRRR